MSNTLGNFSKGLMDLSNMFNLDKLASMNNSGLNKFVNDKLSIQNDMMKQFSFSNRNQYLNFKNGLDSTLASMGSLYNGSDLRNYMSNLSSMGVTSEKMAQDQMRASIMGTKYLGVSTETQAEMFKWMKRTNDYDMLDEHNKIITGLLQSQLGVSKEQLDALSVVAYGGMADKSALGMSSDAVQAQAQASSAMGAVLTSMYDENTAKSIQNALNDFMLNPGDSRWINTFGGQYQSIYNSLFNSNTLEGQSDAINRWLSALQNSNILNLPVGNGGLTTAIGNMKTNSLTALDANTISAMQSFDQGKYTELLSNALVNIDDANAEQFVQETTEITWLENIYNRLDSFFTSIDSAHLVTLANAAFTLMIGSKAFDIYDKMFSSGLVGKLTSSSEAMSKLGASGSGILANGGGILLGAAAITAIGSAIIKSTLSAAGSNQALNNKLNNFNNKSDFGKGISLLGSGFSKSAGGVGSVIGSAFGDAGFIAKSKWLSVSSDYSSGAYDNHSAQLLRLAALMKFDKAGWLKYTNASENHGSIVNQYNALSDEDKKKVQNFANTNDALKSIPGALDWSNYHKAGLGYVPKDNYKALLHKGEMVLNADEANAYRKGYGIGGYEAVPWPITSRYNTMSRVRSGYHTGTDFGAPMGTPVGAAIGGEIIQRNWGSAWGNHIIIRGDNGLYYLYAHLSRKAVEGGRVNTGQTIGYVGSTGNSTGPHLHFEVQRSSSWARGNELDPAPYVTAGLLGDGSAITPTVEEAYGTPAGNLQTTDGSTSSMTSSNAIPIRTKRFIPSSMNSTSYGHGGADRIVNSVNGGFGKLMNYLDDIRKEQDLQKEMINTFSRTNTEGVI